MARTLIATVLILGTLAGCGRVAESRLNPFNWFGSSRSEATLAPEGGYGEIDQDLRRLMDQVSALNVEKTPGGAIIRATGLPPEQGYYDGELVSVSDDKPVDGVLEYQFRVRPPLRPNRASTPQSREVVVGLFVTNQALDGVREIRVVAARNTRAVRR
ncbi:hypothetical protein [Oceaniglobus trochenteri]|uniref:hypothetical protein n=1 Tax=Oceaniglobus trochenteri TaxID=2763260 RepID=UPI001CFF70B7|nr:hypothetical protein [Oceaniglobus trochenteri]